jgi:hypothetical protein
MVEETESERWTLRSRKGQEEVDFAYSNSPCFKTDLDFPPHLK